MFNTKRIKELEKEVRDIDRWVERLSKIMRETDNKILSNMIPCHTCKCLIRKEDAIRGQSEVRHKRTVNEKLGECLIGKMFEIEQEETIYTPYYCHNKDCKPNKK